MPAKSKKQQQLFGLVHAYQTGKVSADKVSARVKHIAQSISPDEAKKFASTPHTGLDELKRIYQSPEFVQASLEEIASSGFPAKVKGSYVDKYTAAMLLTVSNKLNEENRKELFSRTLNEAVAIAYKIVTY